ncbi:TPA_asm: hypothetical protein vir526_00042 [Caudoviricetes sp. vir526]|nr:TPA_asm: hypothetical protein vir526_00042 [Caudoviricetes sp. vir526]
MDFEYGDFFGDSPANNRRTPFGGRQGNFTNDALDELPAYGPRPNQNPATSWTPQQNYNYEPDISFNNLERNPQTYFPTETPRENPFQRDDRNYGALSTNRQGGGGGNGLLNNGMTPQNMDYKRIGNINDVQMLNQAANAAWGQNLNQMFAGMGSQLGTYGNLANAGYGALGAAAGNTGSLAGGYLNAGTGGLQSLMSSAGQYNDLISQMLSGQQGQGLQNLANQYGQQANAMYNNNFGDALSQQAAKLGAYGNQLMNNQQGQAILNAAQNIGQQGNSLLGQGAVQAGMYGQNAGNIYSALGNVGNVNNFVNQMTGSRGLYNTALQATKNLSPEAAANSYLSQQRGIAQLANQQADQALSGVYQSTRQLATAAADEARRQAAGQLANAGLLNTGAAVKSMTEATANPILNAETQLANTRANYLAAQQQAMGNAVGSLTGAGYSNANNALLNAAQLGLSGMGQQASQLGAAGAGMAQLAQNGLNQQNIGANLLNQQLSGLTSGIGANQAGQQLGANLLNMQQAGLNNAGQLNMQGRQLGTQLSALQQAAYNNAVNAGLQGQQLGMNFAGQQQQLGLNAGNALAGYGTQMQNMYLNGLGNAAQGYGNMANLYGGLYGNAAGLGTQFNDAAYYTPTYARTPGFLEQLGGAVGAIAPTAAAAII